MSSEEIQKIADQINELSSLITKLTNFQSAIRDYDRLRLDGAKFLSFEDEEFQEYVSDMDGIRALACGTAGEAVKAELLDPGAIDHLCHLGETDAELDEMQMRSISAALDKALTRAQSQLEKVLTG
ncbi:MAG TPA: hypothetical protein VGL56_10495 [Fimbriimonadaceae bacterium]|jgi:hypothetical protein